MPSLKRRVFHKGIHAPNTRFSGNGPEAIEPSYRRRNDRPSSQSLIKGLESPLLCWPSKIKRLLRWTWNGFNPRWRRACAQILLRRPEQSVSVGSTTHTKWDRWVALRLQQTFLFGARATRNLVQPVGDGIPGNLASFRFRASATNAPADICSPLQYGVALWPYLRIKRG